MKKLLLIALLGVAMSLTGCPWWHHQHGNGGGMDRGGAHAPAPAHKNMPQGRHGDHPRR